MQNLSSILQNHVLFISIFASFMAQAIKLLVELIRHRKINLRSLFSTGGMPSSHSALVGALATGVGIQTGWQTNEFAIAALFAVIVMYDAAGVRQAAGKQARILNQMIDELFQENASFSEERLKELLGHTPVQVIAGLALGIAIAFILLEVI